MRARIERLSLENAGPGEREPTRPIGPTSRINRGLSLFDSGSLADPAVRQVVVDGVQGRLYSKTSSSSSKVVSTRISISGR